MIVLICSLCDITANAAHEVLPAPEPELSLDVVSTDVAVLASPGSVPELGVVAGEMVAESDAGENPDALVDGGVADSDGTALDGEAELPQPTSAMQIAAQTATSSVRRGRIDPRLVRRVPIDANDCSGELRIYANTISPASTAHRGGLGLAVCAVGAVSQHQREE